MTSGPPDPAAGPTPRQTRARQVALFLLGVAAVLLVSSVTWFGSDRPVVGAAQVAVGVALAAVGGVLHRRATRGAGGRLV